MESVLISKEGESLATGHEPQRRASIHKERRFSNPLVELVADADEHLGDDFENFPWLPPSVEKAEEFKQKNTFRSGTAKLSSVRVTNAPDLSIGVCLYFQFAKSATVCFLVMSILSIPGIIFSHSGKRIPVQYRDALGLYKYTLGNIGYDPTSLTYAADSTCEHTPGATVNDTCIHVMGKEILLTNAESVLTLMEFLQILVFFCFIWYLQHKASTLKEETEKDNCSTTDYTIMVRKLPADCSMEQVIAHFNNLYPLDKVDWRGRPQIVGARPVEDIGNSGIPIHKGTWIAECTLFKSIGKYLQVFKDQQSLMQKLYRSRAQMKMYAEGTPHKHGADHKRWQKAEKMMVNTSVAIEMLTEKLLKNKLKVKDVAEMEAQGQSVSFNDTVDEKAVAAFVTFEYCESFARCIEDYQRYSSFPRSLFYPSALKFRGTRITVRKAPEPDEVIWENLEVPTWLKSLRRFRTSIITFILIIVSFAIIVQASVYKVKFSNDIPDLTLCNTYIPQSYGGVSFTDFTAVKIVRPPEAERDSYDASCKQYNADSFYAIYTYAGDFTQPMANFNVSVCDSQSTVLFANQSGICPHYGQTTFCPCVSVTDTSNTCSSLGCTPDAQGSLPLSTDKCKTYYADTIGSCYCQTFLTDLVKSGSASAALDYVLNSGKDVCTNFISSYSKGTGLTYATIVASTVINFMLKDVLKRLTVMESHVSIDHEQGSLIVKIFVATYLNMAVIVLLAFGKIDNLPSPLVVANIFQGTYDDFNSEWYGNVGSYFITGFVVQAVTPIATAMVAFLVTKPLSRFMAYPAVKSMKSHKIVMQRELNDLAVGPIFDTTANTAQLLALLFFAMTYAAGLPLMMPMAFFTFGLYFLVDRYLVCRFFQRPPNMGEGAIKLVIESLPIAAVIRLAIACWMYGNPVVFKESLVASSGSSKYGSAGFLSTQYYQSWLDSNEEYFGAPGSRRYFVAKRIIRPHVFPLFVLWLIIIAVIIIRRLWKQLPFYWVYRILQCFSRLCSRNAKVFDADGDGQVTFYELMAMDDPLRQEACPFTGEYFKYVSDKNEIPTQLCCAPGPKTTITPGEEEEGWQLRDQGNYVVKVNAWMQVTRTEDGLPRKKGDLRRTFEVIDSHGCYSYKLEKIPAYSMAIEGLRAGTQSIMEYQTGALQKEVKELQEQFEHAADHMETGGARQYSPPAASDDGRRPSSSSSSSDAGGEDEEQGRADDK